MKRIVALISALVLVAASLQAQPNGADRLAIKVGLSPAYAIDRLGDKADYGGGAMLALEFRPFSGIPEVSFQINGNYLMLKARAEGDPDVTLSSGLFDLKLTPSWQSESHLYLFAGGGYGTIELKDAGVGDYLVDSLSSEEKPLVEVGIGMERKGRSGLGYFVEIAGVNLISDRFGDYRYGRLTFGLIF